MRKLWILTFLVLCFCVNSIAQTIPTNGLIAWYPFNGNANDQSGNSLNGTAYGATLTTDRFGNTNSAYYFDGIDDFIEVAHNSILNFNANEDFTISVWVLAETPINNNPTADIVAKWNDFPGGNNDPYPYSIRMNRTNPQGVIRMLRYDKSCGNFVQFFSNNSVIDGAWHNLIFRKKGSRLDMFFDCLIESNTTDNSSCNTLNNNPLFMGKRGGTLNPAHYKGKIDELAIYNRALTNCEIASICNPGFSLSSNQTITKVLAEDINLSKPNSSNHIWFINGDTISTTVVFNYDIDTPALLILKSRNQLGCLSIDSFNIVIEIGQELFIPNVITANGDGFNDCFSIPNLDKFESNRLIIYNRYGREIFKQSNYHSPWCAEGTSSGTYFYHLSLNDGSINFKGFVEVLK